MNMRTFLEGPMWAGMWTELSEDVLQRLGFSVDVFYHNVKSPKARLVSKLNKFAPFSKNFLDWENLQRKNIIEKIGLHHYDCLFSIQGKLDSDFIFSLKQKKPGIKIIYWLGDVLLERPKSQLQALKAASVGGALDCLLVSYRGVYEKLVEDGFKNIVYFPFGVSKRFHSSGQISAEDRARFTSSVSFVGTCYRERAEIISYLNRNLEQPVQVWGRGWLGSGIKSNGRLSLQESLKVYACSKISLNIHHHLTDNGFNMKFFEIPAAGGFQICDWQEELSRSSLSKTQSFTSKEELLSKIKHFLDRDGERITLEEELQKTALESTCYDDGFRKLLEKIF